MEELLIISVAHPTNINDLAPVLTYTPKIKQPEGDFYSNIRTVLACQPAFRSPSPSHR
jgi:hypothetical protein